MLQELVREGLVAVPDTRREHAFHRLLGVLGSRCRWACRPGRVHGTLSRTRRCFCMIGDPSVRLARLRIAGDCVCVENRLSS
jgi:hypothetical protein